MQADVVLRQLKHPILQGWPDAKRSIPESIYLFWNYMYQYELSVDHGLIFKTCKFMIPTMQQPELLKDLHVVNLAEKKTLLQVQECVYWPGITEDV